MWFVWVLVSSSKVNFDKSMQIQNISNDKLRKSVRGYLILTIHMSFFYNSSLLFWIEKNIWNILSRLDCHNLIFHFSFLFFFRSNVFFQSNTLLLFFSITIMFRIHTHLKVGVCSCCQDLSKSVCFEQTDVSQMENEMHSLGKKGV